MNLYRGAGLKELILNEVNFSDNCYNVSKYVYENYSARTGASETYDVYKKSIPLTLADRKKNLLWFVRRLFYGLNKKLFWRV